MPNTTFIISATCSGRFGPPALIPALMAGISKAELQRGFGWVVRSHDATYRAAAIGGDEIVVRTWVSEIAKFASRRKYVVCRPADRTVLTRVETRWVYVDLQGGKVVAIPADLRSQLVVPQDVPPLPWECC